MIEYKEMKILVTGGHLTPALAVIDKLLGHEIVFVGRKYALEREQTLSLEYKEITKRKIRFINLNTGRINRSVSVRDFLSILRIPFGLYQGLQIIKEERPQRLLSFGGYLAAPVAFWAWVFGIPIFHHEQTIQPGLSSRFVALLAKRIFVSFAETSQYFPAEKTVVTGNPVRQAIFKIRKKPFKVEKNKPVIYITGGSLGSHSINMHVKNILDQLLENFIVIHQTGDTKEYQDFEELEKYRKGLPSMLKNNYLLRRHFFEEEIGYIYSLADLVIGRAGANTFFELLALEKPTIFIPLPWSGHKEQQKQAEIFKQNRVGEIFLQSEKSAELFKLIDNVNRNLNNYKSSFKHLKFLYKRDAANTIIEELLKA